MTDSQSAFAVRAEFEVLTAAGAPRFSPTATECLFGKDFRFDFKQLQRYCLAHLEEVDVDLLMVAGAVAYADRMTRRRRGTSWGRALRLTIPVHDPSQWEDRPVVASLTEMLRFLTGDSWGFSFVPREPDTRSLQLFLRDAGPGGIEDILPYSGGLDSFAGLRHLLSTASNRPFLITTEHNNGVRARTNGTIAELHNRCYAAGLPIKLSVGAHPEPSYRTRTFLFYSIAALAWKMASARTIVVAETGQGAIGPSLVAYGNEHPYRSTHPAFTKRLAQFLGTLWGKQPEFAHPFLWQTKPTVLRELASQSLVDGYLMTHSCAVSLRRKAISDLPTQCGVCASCILRRLSIAIGVGGADDVEDYVWGDLGATTLQEAVRFDSGVETTDNDFDIAFHGVLCHQHLADVLPGSVSVAQAGFEAARAVGLSTSDATSRVVALVAQHRAEWNAFLARLPISSWVMRLLGGV